MLLSAVMLHTVAKRYILQHNCPPKNTILHFWSPTLNLFPQTPHPNILTFYLLIISCRVEHMTILFRLRIVNSLMAEYRYHGDDWCTIGCSSAIAALLVITLIYHNLSIILPQNVLLLELTAATHSTYSLLQFCLFMQQNPPIQKILGST